MGATSPRSMENYEVDPQTLLRQFDFEEQGDEMMGIYHSHPVSVAYPSATDAWNAHYPECVYFICSLEHDTARSARLSADTPLDRTDWEAHGGGFLRDMARVYLPTTRGQPAHTFNVSPMSERIPLVVSKSGCRARTQALAW